MSRRKIQGELPIKGLLTDQEKTYVTKRLQGKDKGEAYRASFDPEREDPKWSDPLGGGSIEKREHVNAYMQRVKELLRKKVVDSADAAFDRIEALAKFGESERVRLDANKTIIDMSGIKEESASFGNLNLFNIIDPQQVAQAIKKAILESAQQQMAMNNVIEVEHKEVLNGN